MSPYSANPFIYIFSAVAIVGVVSYYLYGIIDRTGLEVSTAVATVTGKQFNPSGRTYHATSAGGQTYVQSQETPETYVLRLNIGQERTVGLVSKELYDSLRANDSVQVKFRRTRFTARLEVVDVRR